MDSGSDNDLAGLITGFASDPAMRRQLRRLPVFVVPDNSESVFRSLLNKLEQAIVSGSGGPTTDTENA
jgi:hypothetical protein